MLILEELSLLEIYDRRVQTPHTWPEDRVIIFQTFSKYFLIWNILTVTLAQA